MVHLFSEMFVLQFSKVEKASTEQVDAAHKQFMAALASLYLKHNTDKYLLFYVIAKLLIVFPSYEIYALCAYLRPINLGRR